MILGDSDIQKALKNGEIEIKPKPAPEQYTTSAVDLRLGDEFLELRPPVSGMEITIDAHSMDVRQLYAQYGHPLQKQPDGSVIIEPKKLILAKTMEYVRLPQHIAARVEGRSTLARIGLLVHLTAPTIHAGFRGRIVLELYNVGPYKIKLTPGMPICQLIFELLASPGRMPTPATPYQDQSGIIQ